MVPKDFEVGDLVWAKMKGFPSWPAKIIEPPAEARSKFKKGHHYVFFFGSDNHAWIPDENITHHDESLIPSPSKKKSAAFQNAIEAIVSQSKNHAKKSKSSTSPKPDKEKEKAQLPEKESAKSSSVQVNNVAKKHEGKGKIKKMQLKPKGKDDKSPKKSLKRRISHSEDFDENDRRISSYTKIQKISEYSSLRSSNSSTDNGFEEISMVDQESSSHMSPGILSRPSYVERPPTPELDIETVSEALKSKGVKPTDKKIGFLGLGNIGRGIVKNLLNSGHHVTIWNRSPEKMEGFVKAGAHKAQTPADVVSCSDIIFCCVSDPYAAKSLVFGNCGVLSGLESNKMSNKGYVEMTSIDPETSQEIAEAITMKGARYLEAPVNGSKQNAEEGSLFILGAGDRSLFADCETCFQAMGNHAYFISCEVGSGSRMNLIVNMLHGSVIAALAESMALVERVKLSQNDFLEVLQLGTLKCSAILEKGRAILHRNFITNTPLKHMQKDLTLALGVGNSHGQPLPLAAAANEIYKHARLLRYADHDVSAVYQGSKF